MALINKLAEIQKLNIHIKKSEDNPFFKSKYVPLESIQDTLNPILVANGLVVYHRVADGNLITTIADTESDIYLESAFPITQGLKPQEVGSAITYGKRYNLGALFNIITDDDDDGNGSSGKKVKKVADEDGLDF